MPRRGKSQWGPPREAVGRWPVGEPDRMRGRLEPWRAQERLAMGELLRSIPWEIYCTWTFREAIGPERALKQIRSWIHTLGFSYGGQLGYMIGLEHDHGAAWCHGHGLLVAPELAKCVTLYGGKVHEKTVPFVEPFWLAWVRRHGSGFFKLIEGDGSGCAFYCAKYSAKRGEVYFSTGLERFRGAPPSSPVVLFPDLLCAHNG